MRLTQKVRLLPFLVITSAGFFLFSSGCKKEAAPKLNRTNRIIAPQSQSEILKEANLQTPPTATVFESPYSSPTRPEVEVQLELQLEENGQIIGIRDLNIEQATTEAHRLRLAVIDAMQKMVHGTFIPDDKSVFIPGSASGPTVSLFFQHPGQPSQTIQTLKGSLKVIHAEHLETFTATNFKSLVEDRSDGSPFSKILSGVSVTSPDFDGGLPSYVFTFNKDALVIRASILTPDGRPANEFWPTIDVLPDGRSRIIIEQHHKELTDDLSLQFELASKLREERVDFSNENLQVPSTETSPSIERPQFHRSKSLPEHKSKSIVVEAYVKRSEFPLPFQNDERTPHLPVEVHLEIFGDRIADTVALGHLKIDRLLSNAGTLKRVDDPTSYFSRLQHGFVTYAPQDHYVHPPVEGAIATFQFESPPGSVTAIDEFAGELRIVIAKSDRYFIVNDLMDSLDTPLINSILKEHNLELIPTLFGDGINISLTANDALKVTDIVAIDQSGGESKTIYSGRQQFGNKTTYSFHAENELPPKLPVRIRINQEIEEIRIPFEFSDLPIPAP